MTTPTTPPACGAAPAPNRPEPHLPAAPPGEDDVSGQIWPLLVLGGALLLAACTPEEPGERNRRQV